MDMVQTEKLIFEYEKRDEEGNIIGTSRAIDEVDIDVKEGQFIAILGHNGSGKSTLAKHINAILVPTGGTMWVGGRNTSDPAQLWNVRQSAGMVFQNPDNQIIGTVVEEDVGFGPENLGVPTDEIWQRVEESLKAVGMIEYRHHSPNKLSGGQKRSVGIAGVLAMNPSILILDEPAAGLDPYTKRQVFDLILKIQKKRNLAVVLVSHHMEDVAVYANRVWVMHQGELVLQGSPIEIFSQTERLKEMNIGVPQITSVTEKLIRNGLPLERVAVSVDDAENMILQMLNRRKAR